jgi:DNA (cytosine-5)-methyltransferase 1
MIDKHENVYILRKEHLENIVPFQLEEAFQGLEFDPEGNVIIPYVHKGYTCKDKIHLFENSEVQALSFFSGCGGLDIGTQLAGVKVISSLDFDEDSVNTLKKNSFFEHSVHFNEDIVNIKGSDFTNIIKKNNPSKLIVVGGPPCQPFSKAGYWVTNEKRQANNDPRNMIVPYFKIISEVMPDGFVLENVESILHPSNSEAVETIVENMERLGYHYSILKINAADYGIPQKRKRVFFLASKKKIHAELPATHGDKKSIQENPELLPHERVIDWIAKFDNDSYYADENVSTEGKWEHELTCVPPGKNYIALTERAGHPNPTFVAGKRYWSSLLKLHPYQPSWTIIASPGHWEGPFHWNNRRLSIRECAAIQTFPDDYMFHGSLRSQRKQIGNAVPPLLAKMIVEELGRWL